jgi:hypothetical protein
MVFLRLGKEEIVFRAPSRICDKKIAKAVWSQLPFATDVFMARFGGSIIFKTLRSSVPPLEDVCAHLKHIVDLRKEVNRQWETYDTLLREVGGMSVSTSSSSVETKLEKVNIAKAFIDKHPKALHFTHLLNIF